MILKEMNLRIRRLSTTDPNTYGLILSVCGRDGEIHENRIVIRTDDTVSVLESAFNSLKYAMEKEIITRST